MKTETHRWHKVADGELPTDEETYVLRTKTPGTFIGWYHDGKWWKPGYSRYEDGEVIAWYNVPEFEDAQVDEYVDLGLTSGTLWARRNIGAKNIEDGGIYFTFKEDLKQGNVPTKEQFKELIDECEWTWKGNGYEVVGMNGNSIFLPAAGYRDVKDIINVGSNGVYWSSSASDDYYAYCLYFYNNENSIFTSDRNYGLSVRLVK